jgi:hypothetical protein
MTKKERDTLNAALAIIEKHTALGASWQIYASRYKGVSKFTHDITYFDSQGGQHSLVSSRDGGTFADRVSNALEMERKALGSRERIRAMRVERLRKELSELTGEAA